MQNVMNEIDYLLIYPKIDEHSGDQYIPLSIMKVGARYEAEGYNVEYWDERCDSYYTLIELAGKAKHVMFSSMEGTQWEHCELLMGYLREKLGIMNFYVGGYKAINKGKEKLESFYYKSLSYDVHFINERFDMQDPVTEKTKRFYKIFKPLLFTSFGCNNKCRFCTVNGKWTPVPVNRVIKEIWTIKNAGHDFVSIGDPNFKWDKRIGEELKSCKMKWHCNMDVNKINYKTIKEMSDCGCVSIEIGLETTSERLRELLNCKFKSTVLNYFKLEFVFKKFPNVSPMFSFMVGLPTETREDLLDLMTFIDITKSWIPQARFSMYTYASYPSELQRMFPEHVNFDIAKHSLYWLCGLKFRKDNIRKNFRGLKRLLSLPFELWANVGWKFRIFRFPKKYFEYVLQLVKRSYKK
nr:MAG: tRNA methylthiotransferase-like protein [Lokiarchaeota virus Ratatoskr Meg22_1012]